METEGVSPGEGSQGEQTPRDTKALPDDLERFMREHGLSTGGEGAEDRPDTLEEFMREHGMTPSGEGSEGGPDTLEEFMREKGLDPDVGGRKESLIELEHEMLAMEAQLIRKDQRILADMIGKFSHEEIDLVLSDDHYWGPSPRDPFHEEGKGRKRT